MLPFRILTLSYQILQENELDKQILTSHFLGLLNWIIVKAALFSKVTGMCIDGWRGGGAMFPVAPFPCYKKKYNFSQSDLLKNILIKST